jgi:hypothetical protein
MTQKQIVTNILLFGMVFLLAYTLGISIVNLINSRLENISITMPKVEVAAPQVTVQLHKDPTTCSVKTLPKTHFKASTEIDQKGGGSGAKSETLTKVASGCATKPPAIKECQTGKCSSDWQCNQVYGGGANRCTNGKCQCRFGTGFYCHLQPTFYLDPKLMTPEQVVKFKKRARLDRMTLQDYQNWLGLFTYDLESLPLVHRKNYWRLRRGDAIEFVPICVGDNDPADLRSDSSMIAPNQQCGVFSTNPQCGTAKSVTEAKVPQMVGGSDNPVVPDDPRHPDEYVSPERSMRHPEVSDGSTGLNVPATGGRGPGGQIPGLPDDVRMFRVWGGRKLADAGIRPEAQDLIDVKLRIPAVEADTAHNYLFTDEHLDTTGYVHNVNDFSPPLQWSNYTNAFQPNKKYQEFDDDKMRRFKTTPVASWFQNSAIELSDLVESTFFDPKFSCN